ncbi:unnamed protein product, partial [marine sediment metagenome]
TDFLGIEKLTAIGGAISALRKEVFLEAGGFDTHYMGADVEDFDLGHKIAKNHILLFNSKIQGKHYFPTLWKACKNFYKRSGQWSQLFMKRKRFDTGAASKRGGISSVVSGLLTLSFFVMLIWPYAMFHATEFSKFFFKI